jgi:preprotein translocase subunit SecD
VKGFAFTLGLTTVIDVLIFVIFTHPVMQLLARTRFFGGGHKLSGLDPEALGAVYRSRSQYREVATASAGRGAKNARSRGEADRRQTIAERKRAEALAAERQTTAGREGDN